MKMGQEGDLQLWGQDNASRLGAPFGANYNDFPITEEYTFWTGGQLSKFFGLMAASNLTVCLAHILAGIGLFAACRRLSVSDSISLPLAIIYSGNTYLAIKGLGHLGFSFLWHLPLGIVASIILFRQGKGLGRFDWVFLLLIAVITSISNIYYTFILVQFWAMASFASTIREKELRNLLPFTGMLLVVICGFTAMNMDTFSYAREYGPNLGATQRNYQGMEIYSLKPLEMLLPPQKVPLIGDLTAQYYTERMLNSEPYSPYIGFIGVLGLVWIITSATISAARNQCPSGYFWATVWILLFSCLGGINIIFAYFTRFYAFRATTRFSILILTLALLFIAVRVNRLGRFRRVATIALWLLIPICLLDQYPKVLRLPEVKEQTRATVESDKEVSSLLEGLLPAQSAVFQLPVMESPESPPINQLHDYELLRPYLASSNLRFSYGNNKGRETDKWLKDTAKLPPEKLISALSTYGFSALMINKLGFEDEGAQLDQELQALSLPRHAINDWIIYTFKPSKTPELPILPTGYSRGWYPEEKAGDDSWAWSDGSTAELRFQITNEGPIELSMSLQSLVNRNIKLQLNGKQIHAIDLQPGSRQTLALHVLAQKGVNLLKLFTDAPPARVPGDERHLAYALYNFNVTAFATNRAAVFYPTNWYEQEINGTDTYRWCASKDSTLEIHAPFSSSVLSFQIEGINEQVMKINYAGESREVELKPGGRTKLEFKAKPGFAILVFSSNAQATIPKGDSRSLLFRVINLQTN